MMDGFSDWDSWDFYDDFYDDFWGYDDDFYEEDSWVSRQTRVLPRDLLWGSMVRTNRYFFDIRRRMGDHTRDLVSTKDNRSHVDGYISRNASIFVVWQWHSQRPWHSGMWCVHAQVSGVLPAHLPRNRCWPLSL